MASLRTARLNMAGEIAASLAHELNQPLATASNYLAVLEHEISKRPDSESARDLAEHARRSIERVGDIIRTLRSFISSDERAPTPLILNDVVQEGISLATLSPGQRMSAFTISIEPPDLCVFADRIQLQQVLVNIIRNAIEAMEQPPVEAPAITIRASTGNHFTLVSIRDNGPGFARAVLEKERLPMTTKSGESMGLGLLICRRIIEDNGGHLRLCNHPKGGALVQFSLPLTEVHE